MALAGPQAWLPSSPSSKALWRSRLLSVRGQIQSSVKPLTGLPLNSAQLCIQPLHELVLGIHIWQTILILRNSTRIGMLNYLNLGHVPKWLPNRVLRCVTGLVSLGRAGVNHTFAVCSWLVAAVGRGCMQVHGVRWGCLISGTLCIYCHLVSQLMKKTTPGSV